MTRIARWLVLLLSVATLAGCGHARVVRMEGQTHRPGTSRATAGPASLPRPAPESVPRDGVHVVQAGETLYGISFRYGLRYQDVAAWNHLDDASVIEVGQRLLLKPPASVASAASQPTPPPRAARPSAIAAPPPIATTPAPAATPAIATPAPPRPAMPIIAVAAPSWRWPTPGPIIGRFVAGDPTQQGIDIAGNAGQPVVAAADGVVVYSGAGLVGYGELIIIKHNDQWLSAYAHNRRRLVAEGARIKAGDVIAEMGRSGAIRDMLHFEIRLNGKPVDPLQYLPQR